METLVSPLLYVAMGAALLLAIWALGRALSRARLKRRFSVAARAERDAVTLAERAGYRVLGAQVPGRVTIHVDGRPETLDLRADLLLARRGRRYVGEVKSGDVVTSPTHSATRRQLLEYSQAFPVDGILLFDMAKKRIHEVRFTSPRHQGSRLRLYAAALASALGGVLLERAFALSAHLWPFP